MRCPKCETDSVAGFALPQLSFARCETCRGIWLNGANVRRVVGSGDRVPSGMEDLFEVLCWAFIL